MPANEQTWRDMKALHLVFGISSCILLVATLWLLASDHNREYKTYQQDFEAKETWIKNAQIAEFQTVRFSQESERLHDALLKTRYQLPDANLVNEFLAALPADDEFQTVKPLIEAKMAELKELSSSLPPASAASDEGASSEDKDKLAAFAAARQDLFALMRGPIARLQYIEDQAAQKKKARSAKLDEAKSKYDLAVRDVKGAETLHKLEAEIDKIKNGADENDMTSVAAYTLAFQTANLQRSALESIVKQLTDAETNAQKELAAHSARRDALVDALPQASKNIIGMPILDAFGGPWKPKQNWLPNLTIPNGSFGEIARFDRCISCHLGIDKSAPGTADVPAYPARHEVTVLLATPEEAPAAKDDEGNERKIDTQSLYGIVLADEGWNEPTDVSIQVVWPEEAGARAGLQMGDTITHIRVGDRVEKVNTRAEALRYLVEQAPWGELIEVTVQRGLPQPYSTHPRLDLFVGSLSPHKIEDMGCTICHEGQGSATEFKWVSHTPDNPEQAHEWARKHGYFNNHHWIFPMRPNRFIESSCMKCHHEVEQLAPSERFPEPPAPKLTEGYDLVRSIGCYGCHEINGYDGPETRIGPDLRNEPPYFAAAAQLKYLLGPQKEKFQGELASNGEGDGQAALMNAVKTLSEMDSLSHQVAHHPEDDASRNRLYFLLQSDAERADAASRLLADPGLSGEMRDIASQLKNSPEGVSFADRQKLVDFLRDDQEAGEPTLRPDAKQIADQLATPTLLSKGAHKLGELLKTVESPGSLRRVGPSLRHVASKLGGDTLYRWIFDPRSIRPTSKMPRFFSHHKHYDYLTDASAKTADNFETIEAYSAAVYLLDKSQPFEYLPVQDGVTEEPDFDRGRTMFRTKGCLACHQHSEDPSDPESLLGESTQGPNLSELGKKLRSEKGKKWLHSWMLGPSHYNLRTRMPNVMLEPEALLDEEGKTQEQDGKVRKYDPAADITLYLLGEDWKADEDKLAPLTAEQLKSLDALAYEYLESAFPEVRAKRYLANGIPQKVASKLVGHEVELAVDENAELSDADREADLLEKKLNYVGRRTIGKLGCAGCHDVPGLEAAKPIGTTLADWGRKESSKLAFEHITEYLGVQQSQFGEKHGDHAEHGGEGHHEHEHIDPVKWDLNGRDAGYFIEAMHHHQREGFLWQKLREPRSYDYHKTDAKGYNERLRMPLFNWNKDEQGELTESGRREIESVMTFVLGLVAEPPAPEYVFDPGERGNAIVEGEKVLARFNCAGCHVLTLDRWDIDFDPALHAFEPVSSDPGYPFVEPFFTPDEIAATVKTAANGKQQAILRGMPRLDASGIPEELVYIEDDEEFIPTSELEEGEDFDENSLFGTPVELWQPAVISGNVFDVKAPLPTIPSDIISRHTPGRGGAFARWLIPQALELENSQGGSEAWAWVPPPLIDQGRKTQPEWLHDFLLDPHMIRPAAILRMPKFNMSSDEATKLVHYFAARDNSEYPHQFNYRTRREHLEAREAEYAEKLAADGETGTRFEDAFEIVVNKEGCVKCHLVSDFDPGGSPRAKGPNLADVTRRLQADYLKRWLAKPDSILPYTKMPVNFPYGPEGFIMKDPETGESVQLYHGDSTQQIDGIVDLLMNLDTYLEEQISIKDKVSGDSPPAEQ